MALVARMSMPWLLRSEIEAMCPRRDNSAATKYSPATRARREVTFWSAVFGFMGDVEAPNA